MSTPSLKSIETESVPLWTKWYQAGGAHHHTFTSDAKELFLENLKEKQSEQNYYIYLLGLSMITEAVESRQAELIFKKFELISETELEDKDFVPLEQLFHPGLIRSKEFKTDIATLEQLRPTHLERRVEFEQELGEILGETVEKIKEMGPAQIAAKAFNEQFAQFVGGKKTLERFTTAGEESIWPNLTALYTFTMLLGTDKGVIEKKWGEFFASYQRTFNGMKLDQEVEEAFLESSVAYYETAQLVLEYIKTKIVE